MNLLQVSVLVFWLFYLHHALRGLTRHGFYATLRLQKLVRSRSFSEIERLAGNLHRHPHCSPRLRATALRCRAWARICSGQLRGAHDDLTRALEWNPRDGRAYLCRAMADWYSLPEKALTWLDLAERNRDLWGRRAFTQTVARFRGLALTRLCRGQEAMAQFSAIPGPPDVAVRRYVAQALALCGRYQEALAGFEAAGEENPRLALGSYLLQAERPHESAFWLDRACREQPTTMALFLKAGALIQLGDERQATGCLEEWMGILLRPSDFSVCPELTEFGRLHLVGRHTASASAQSN